jgi:hypothetical protein
MGHAQGKHESLARNLSRVRVPNGPPFSYIRPQMTKILFILKRKENGDKDKILIETGLYHSAKFIKNMLDDSELESKMVVVTDNNDIDREVTLYKPDFVIIEALWVVPSKFAVLKKLHPSVKWIIRIHSNIPFMAQEGIAMDWILDYSEFDDIIIAPNSPKMLHDIEIILQAKKSLKNNLIYLPNYYPVDNFKEPKKTIDLLEKPVLDICCFGAIRPLKNQLTQAIAAIDFATQFNKPLRFHVNSERYETNGLTVFHNLKGLFQNLDESKFSLVTHPWSTHEEFLNTCSVMDLGLQVSFSETFNIVAADLLSVGVPLVGSAEIPWLHDTHLADPTSSLSIFNSMVFHYYNSELNLTINRSHLIKYNEDTKNIWLNYFRNNI